MSAVGGTGHGSGCVLVKPPLTPPRGEGVIPRHSFLCSFSLRQERKSNQKESSLHAPM